MIKFHELLAILGYSQPVAIWQDWLYAQITAEKFQPEATETEARIAPQTQRATAAKSGVVVTIPVQGVITAKPTPWERYGFSTSVDTLVKSTRAAVADPSVKAIVWRMDTPGGSTSGVTEGFSDLMALRGRKPIIAQVDHLAASAGYWLASAANEIAAAPSSLTGSVGVYSMHANTGRMMEAAGIDIEFIQAGKDKTLGNQFAPLSDEGRAYMQGLVNHAYAQFTGDVAAGRNADIGMVRGEAFGNGRVLTADAAKKAGMVDVIRTLDQTLAAYGATAPTGDRQRRAYALKLRELENHE